METVQLVKGEEEVLREFKVPIRPQFPPLTVVVTTFNRPEYLNKTLSALVPQLRREDEAIVVNDGGPHPPIPEGVRYLWQRAEGWRLATTCNRGIANAANQFIVNLNDDCVPMAGFLDSYRRRIRRGVLLLGGFRFLYDHGSNPPPPGVPLYWERSEYIPLLAGKLEGGYGGNMCFSRDDALMVGGFDERFNGCWGYEDTAFIKAMMLRGVRVERCYEAKVEHQPHPINATLGGKERNRRICVEVVAEYERGIYPVFDWKKYQG